MKGVDNTLTLDVNSGANAQQTASAATIGIFRGPLKVEVVAAGTAATGLGPPATYTLDASDTSALTIDPTEKWDVQWKQTIGGVVEEFRRPGWLVEFRPRPQIVDQDLVDAEPELGSFVLAGGSLADTQTQIVDAWDYLLWDLYRRGIQVHQITDGASLIWPHIARSIANLYGMARWTDDDHFQDKRTEWLAIYEDAMGRPFPIDADASGAADEQDKVPADPAWPVSPTRPRVW